LNIADQKKTEDQEQEQTKEEFPENEIHDQEEQLAVLDAAIEYKLKGFYSEGVTVDQKRSARRKAKSISVEHGEVFILKKKGKVHTCTFLFLHHHCLLNLPSHYYCHALLNMSPYCY